MTIARQKPPPGLALMSLGIFVVFGGFILLVLGGATLGLSASTVGRLKPGLALCVWVWLYLMTSSVARWKGRRGWPWFLAGIGSMWGTFAGVTLLGFAIYSPLLQQPERRHELVSGVATFLLAGFPSGFVATILLSWFLRRSAPLDGAPCLEEVAPAWLQSMKTAEDPRQGAAPPADR